MLVKVKDALLTGNHRGVAVLFLVAVFVGAEALHKACVALRQQLVRENTGQSETREMRCSKKPDWSFSPLSQCLDKLKRNKNNYFVVISKNDIQFTSLKTQVDMDKPFVSWVSTHTS